MAIKLSILIPSTPDRTKMTNELHNKLCLSKYPDGSYVGDKDIEILIDWSADIIGKKRNTMLSKARGEWLVFIDSDDTVCDNYVSNILEAIKTNPDCIGINGTMTTNGQHPQQWFISKSCGRWFTRGNTHYRTPNHISPVRRELALQAGFPEVAFAEDYEYSMRLLPLLKTEVLITEPMYHYDYWNKK
ncbi:MAG TPA: glycosyltransferase [Candidatus Babeliaceae bacterium]|nr:glycosyltransferase [Candidatus Babeliaceae bacterium]